MRNGWLKNSPYLLIIFKSGKGQSPEFLYIRCSDSRVTAEDLMGIQPGDAFIHRNIDNMVVSIDLNIMSVLNYAASLEIYRLD